MKTPPDLPYYAEYPIVAVKRVKNPDDNAEKEVETLKMLNHKALLLGAIVLIGMKYEL